MNIYALQDSFYSNFTFCEVLFISLEIEQTTFEEIFKSSVNNYPIFFIMKKILLNISDIQDSISEIIYNYSLVCYNYLAYQGFD